MVRKRTPRAKGRPAAPSRTAKAAKPVPPTQVPDPLDAFIAAAARSLDLTLDEAWVPAVRGHLQIALAMGAQVGAFALPDEAEPAPVFRA